MSTPVQRRSFLTLLGGAAAAWPLGAKAQEDTRVRRVGVLAGNPADDPNGPANVYTLRQGLAGLGWVERRNLHIDERWPGGDAVRLRNHVRELVALAPDVILTTHMTATQVLRDATRTVPIVFVSVSDPVETGLVANLSRPESNVTGVMLYEYSLVSKWLSLLKSTVPTLAHVALLFNPDTAAPWAPFYVRAAQDAGVKLALEITVSTVRSAAGIESAIAALPGSNDVGLLVLPDIFNAANRAGIIVHAARYRVPAIYPTRFYALGGGLMSYGPSLRLQYHDAAAYVDRILRGATPSELPVQFASKFEHVINLKIAKTMGLAVSQELLRHADEVIE
jgi:putative ABC transport system substrate-binding protein